MVLGPGFLIAALVAVLATASCGSDGPGRDDAAPPDVTVFAAASLTAAFTELGDAFTAANPGAEVTFSFAGSSELVAQLREGAPADVFASADLANMAVLTDADLVDGQPEVFATNAAEIIVEAGNPRGITGVADLENDDLVVVQCAPEVPCGAYAEQVFANAGVTVTPSSLEQNVKAVATKVLLGEADAGVVDLDPHLPGGRVGAQHETHGSLRPVVLDGVGGEVQHRLPQADRIAVAPAWAVGCVHHETHALRGSAIPDALDCLVEDFAGVDAAARGLQAQVLDLRKVDHARREFQQSVAGFLDPDRPAAFLRRDL